MSDWEFEGINGHMVGRILKEDVRRATVVARLERAIFESTEKESYGGSMDDVFTSADTKAQAVYLRTRDECFSRWGVIAEEDKLRIKAKVRGAPHLTFDPVDGTKAYVRGQSHGIATMVGLVHRREIIAAYIGDINTQEIYGYRPGSDKVHRVTRRDWVQTLGREKPFVLKKSHILLREKPRCYSRQSQRLIEHGFKNIEIMGSSIGTWYARLWKNEVAALIMPPGFETPWDSTPVVGISQKLGFVFLKPLNPDGRKKAGWALFEPKILTKVERRPHDTLVIHKSELPQLGIH